VGRVGPPPCAHPPPPPKQQLGGGVPTLGWGGGFVAGPRPAFAKLPPFLPKTKAGNLTGTSAPADRGPGPCPPCPPPPPPPVENKTLAEALAARRPPPPDPRPSGGDRRTAPPLTIAACSSLPGVAHGFASFDRHDDHVPRPVLLRTTTDGSASRGTKPRDSAPTGALATRSLFRARPVRTRSAREIEPAMAPAHPGPANIERR